MQIDARIESVLTGVETHCGLLGVAENAGICLTALKLSVVPVVVLRGLRVSGSSNGNRLEHEGHDGDTKGTTVISPLH